MLTIFTAPKAFKGHFAIIQENAIASWTKLKTRCEIILIGDEEGVFEIAQKYHLKYIPNVKISNRGTPLVSDLFYQAQKNARFPVVAYVNSDIILLDNFMEAIQKINLKSYMIIGQRWELEVNRKINFNKNWQKRLIKELRKRRKIKSNKAVDYFIFPKDLNFNIPPFIIGRYVWDNWFLYQAKKLKIPLIDATGIITAIHQNHDYSHAGGFETILFGEEHQRNLELTPDKRRSFNIANVDWVLTAKGLTRPKQNLYRYWRAIRVYPVLHPGMGFVILPIILGIQFFLDRFKKLISKCPV